MSLMLPGGLVHGGRLHRHVQLHPINGHIEQAMCAVELSRPNLVTRVLCAALDRIGTLDSTESLVEQLSVGDRSYLMLQLGIRFSGDGVWLSPECGECEQAFDVLVRPSELPVLPPEGDGLPTASCVAGDRNVTVRTPHGADQRWLVEARPVDPVRDLMARCVVAVDGAPPKPSFVEALSPADRGVLEQAIEAAGPQVDCAMLARCPTCRSAHPIHFDLCWFVGQGDDLDLEVHQIARRYRWSHDEILGLTRRQRQRFAALIQGDAAHG